MTRHPKAICLCFVILISCLFSGCSSQPSVIGKWKVIEVPQEYKNRGVEAITIDILEDHSFSVNMYSANEDLVDGFDGAWTQLDKNKIEFEMLQPPYNTGSGELLPNDQLMTIGGGFTLYNQRIIE